MKELIDRLKQKYPLLKVFYSQYIGDKIIVYDAKSNLITEISQKDIEKLVSLNSENDTDITSAKMDDRLDIFLSGPIDKVLPNDNEIRCVVEELKETVLPRKFVLELTEKCTLRCNYCLFSDNDYMRKHSQADMSESVAIKAIEYYFNEYSKIFTKISQEERKKILKTTPPNLNWWGGEPLICFDLMKKTKSFFENLPWKRFGIEKEDLQYSFVTNLTILSVEMVDFIVLNHIYLFVSLDGDLECNKNRVYENGRESFTRVLSNLNIIINKYPDYAKKYLVLQSVIADNIDETVAMTYLNEEFCLNTIKSKVLMFQRYPQKHTDVFYSDIQLYKCDNVLHLDAFQKLMYKLNELGKDEIFEFLCVNKSFRADLEDLLALNDNIVFDSPNSKTCFSRLFSCPVAYDQIFVDVNGNLHICNKSDYSMSLGNIYKGLDIDKVIQLYTNYYRSFNDSCKTCWALNFCRRCPANTMQNGRFFSLRKEECDKIRDDVEIRLTKYLILLNNEYIYDILELYYADKNPTIFSKQNGPIIIK